MKFCLGVTDIAPSKRDVKIVFKSIKISVVHKNPLHFELF